MTVTDRQYSAATVEHNARGNGALRRKREEERARDHRLAPGPAVRDAGRPAWRPRHRPPVIALMDSGVQRHRWLPADGDPPFVLVPKTWLDFAAVG